MLTYNFSNIGSDSLYEYLYKCIKNDILLGNTIRGEKLPSKRTFAKNLGISVITVENAYAQLVAEGYLYSMPKRGFYAADLEIEDSMRDAVPKEILQVANGETSYFADFSSNQTDSEIFPFTIWTRTMRAVLNDNRIQLMINSPVRRDFKAAQCDCKISARVSWNAGAAGADYCRRRNGVSA